MSQLNYRHKYFVILLAFLILIVPSVAQECDSCTSCYPDNQFCYDLCVSGDDTLLSYSSCSGIISDVTGVCTADVKTCEDGSTVARDPNNNCEFKECPKGCTKDAKVCSDGTVVGRDPNNNCEFEECPSVSICNNLCGDGVCQEIVCLGTGCPCKEDVSSCPQDCEISIDLCGNGVIDSGEQCDGSELGGKTCKSFGFDKGDLICTNECKIDTSICKNEVQSGFSEFIEGIIDDIIDFFDGEEETPPKEEIVDTGKGGGSGTGGGKKTGFTGEGGQKPGDGGQEEDDSGEEEEKDECAEVDCSGILFWSCSQDDCIGGGRAYTCKINKGWIWNDCIPREEGPGGGGPGGSGGGSCPIGQDTCCAKCLRDLGANSGLVDRCIIEQCGGLPS